MNYKIENTDVKGSRVDRITIQTNEQNSFTRDNLLEFERILEDIRTNPEVRAAVVTSDNEKFFSNGVDATNILNTEEERLPEEMGHIVVFFNYLMTFDKPLLAEVAGHAMGGGAVVALGCDYVAMLQDRGRMSFTEVFFGLPLAGTFIEKLRDKVPPGRLNDVVYGTMFKPPAAAEVGLVNDLAATREELHTLIRRKLEQVLMIPTSAYAGTKRTLHRRVLDSEPAHMQALKDTFADPIVMGNLLEAMAALREGRRPKFQ